MGAEASKIQEVEDEIVPEGSVPSTPILTPKINSIRDLDPRSPSNNIVRTPIETLLMNRKSVDGVLNVIQCTPRFKYLNIDPRSPTVDFNRTPIVVISDVDRKSDLNKRKSGLLETNLDYVETDIDVAYLEKSPLKLCSREESLCEEKHEIKDVDMKIKQVEEEIEKLENKIDDIKLDNIIEEIKDDSQVNINVKHSQNDLIDQNEPENNEILQEKIKTALKDIENLPKDLTVVINTVKDFDKKLTNLIYEDKDTQSVKKDDDGLKLRNRTPLSTRNLNVEAKKVPKLKVADKPKKSNNRLSKIPVSKFNKKKIGVQCENTPPGAFKERERKGKLRRPEWDGDKTLVI